MLIKTPHLPSQEEIELFNPQCERYLRFEELANIPTSNREQFKREAVDALALWFGDTVYYCNQKHPDRILYRMLGTAEELNQQLIELVEQNKSGLPVQDTSSVAFRGVRVKLMEAFVKRSPNRFLRFEDGDEVDVCDIQQMVSALVDVIEHAILPVTKAKGALPRIKYPGLDAFIFRLEVAAKRAGGRFTVHRKLGSKGSLVQALDATREWLVSLGCEPGIAKHLPKPGRHPVSTYERILRKARAHVAAR
jgi:hypothetical protein